MTGPEILAAMEAASLLIDVIDKAAQRAKERGEFTPEQESAFDAKRAEIMSRPHWQKR